MMISSCGHTVWTAGNNNNALKGRTIWRATQQAFSCLWPSFLQEPFFHPWCSFSHENHGHETALYYLVEMFVS
jgi:hypothetical protein